MLTSSVFDIQERYNRGERNFSKAQLRRIDLRKAQLRGINLEGADLSYADLRDADLTGANLSRCYFNEANLTGANLTGANLTGAYFIKAYLIGANCHKVIAKEANFTGSFLSKANFTQADLTGAIFSGAYLSSGVFRDAKYDGTTRLDRGLNPESLGMKKISILTPEGGVKVTLGEVIIYFEAIAAIVSKYLGNTITAKYFEETRPEVEWLHNFSMDKKGKVHFPGSLTAPATALQLKWFEKWTDAFIKKCSLVIQDLPAIVEEKKLTVEHLVKRTIA